VFGFEAVCSCAGGLALILRRVFYTLACSKTRSVMALQLAILTILPGGVAFAAAMDLFTLTIPNRISIVLWLAFLPLASLAGLTAADVGLHIGAGYSLQDFSGAVMPNCWHQLGYGLVSTI
jgi:hypothetical protein